MKNKEIAIQLRFDNVNKYASELELMENQANFDASNPTRKYTMYKREYERVLQVYENLITKK